MPWRFWAVREGGRRRRRSLGVRGVSLLLVGEILRACWVGGAYSAASNGSAMVSVVLVDGRDMVSVWMLL